MNKLLKIIVVFFINANFYAQNSIRVYYQVESKQDIKQDSADVDLYVLDINIKKGTSKFYNFTYLKSDSVYVSLKKQSDMKGAVNFDSRTMKYPNFNIGVLKENSKYDIIQMLDGDVFQYPDGKDSKWNISSEKTKIENYQCQKAKTTIGGRKWSVYFTTELPFYYGPYKLGGLPGLIVSAKDETDSYIFKMVGLEKINDESEFTPKIFSRIIKTSKEKYYRAFNNYKTDPVKKLRENIITYPDGDYMKLANPLSPEYIKKREEVMVKYLRENDNYIEIIK